MDNLDAWDEWEERRVVKPIGEPSDFAKMLEFGQSKSQLLPGGGVHDRLPADERLKDAEWLTFLRHHPDLHVMARRIRREK
jgi:hypothetical protein